jgi:enoyl-CoA hydratase/carnithine racemase
MDYETIRYAVRDHILTITLNRPEKLNAFSSQMMLDLIDAIDHADDDVRAIIVTGEGRGFCAGADLSGGSGTFDYLKLAHRAHNPGSPIDPNGEIDWRHDAIRDTAGRVTLRIFDCLKPVIGAINGAAVGAGATIPLAMDIRIASNTARFGYVFSRRGIVPEGCSSWFLPRVVGISRWQFRSTAPESRDWFLSGYTERLKRRHCRQFSFDILAILGAAMHPGQRGRPG